MTQRFRSLSSANVLGLAAILLAAAAGGAGVLTDVPYVDEAAAWAAQGRGQDVANLLVILPAAAFAPFFGGLSFAWPPAAMMATSTVVAAALLVAAPGRSR